MLGHLFLLWIGHFIETRFLQNIFHKNFQNILLHILHRSMPRASFKKMIFENYGIPERYIVEIFIDKMYCPF